MAHLPVPPDELVAAVTTAWHTHDEQGVIDKIMEFGLDKPTAEHVLDMVANGYSRAIVTSGGAKAYSDFDHDPVFQAALKRARTEIASQPQAAPRSIEELSADAVSHDHSLRRMAAYELRTSRDTAAVQVAISLLSDEDQYVRVYAIQALGKLKPIESVPALIHILQSETDELILTNTIRTVVKIGDVRVVPALIDLTRSTHPFIRHDVAWGLGELGDKRAIPALKGLRTDTTKPEAFDEEGFLTKSSTYRVSDQAERALHRMRPAWRRWLRI